MLATPSQAAPLMSSLFFLLLPLCFLAFLEAKSQSGEEEIK